SPMALPMTQWLGSGLGHMGSTSKRGACVVAASTTPRRSRMREPATSPASNTANPTEIQYLRVIRHLLPSFGIRLLYTIGLPFTHICLVVRRGLVARHPERCHGAVVPQA